MYTLDLETLYTILKFPENNTKNEIGDAGRYWFTKLGMLVRCLTKVLKHNT